MTLELDLSHELGYLFLLSTCADELYMCRSTPNIITFLPNPLPLDNENLLRASNPVPYPECKISILS